jgi:hypothetical protein
MIILRISRDSTSNQKATNSRTATTFIKKNHLSHPYNVLAAQVREKSDH